MSPDECVHRSVGLRPSAERYAGASGTKSFHQIRLGELRIIALFDGATPLPFDKLLTGAAPGEVETRLAASGLTSPVDTCVNTFLIEGGGRLILIDAGAGGNLPGCGRLATSLVAAGYHPDQVDTILLTHIHPDHVGGLISSQGLAFQNASLLTTTADLEYWFSPEEAARAAPERKKIFEQSKAGVLPYLERDRVRAFTLGDELLPGITTIPAPGHAAGHVLVRVESGEAAMVFFGDLAHLAAVQMADPLVAITLDSDQEVAVATRLNWFERFATENTLVAGAHMPFPGIGHIARNGAGYEWLPLDGRPEPSAGPRQLRDSI